MLRRTLLVAGFLSLLCCSQEKTSQTDHASTVQSPTVNKALSPAEAIIGDWVWEFPQEKSLLLMTFKADGTGLMAATTPATAIGGRFKYTINGIAVFTEPDEPGGEKVGRQMILATASQLVATDLKGEQVIGRRAQDPEQLEILRQADAKRTSR